MNDTKNNEISAESGKRRNIEEKFCDFLKKWPKIHTVYCKYEEILVYLVIGGLNTIVSWTAKFLWNYFFFNNTPYPTNIQNTILSTVSWVFGVAFAYPTNRVYVFKSHGPIMKEATKFVISRISTWILDILMMQLLCNILKIDVFVSTVITSVFVVVGNYVFSKIAVFKKNK